MVDLRNSRLCRRFPLPPGERCLRRLFGKPPLSAAFLRKKKNGASSEETAASGGGRNQYLCIFSGTYGAANGLKASAGHEDSEMCLVLKLNNEKLVSIANELTDRTTQYRVSI